MRVNPSSTTPLLLRSRTPPSQHFLASSQIIPPWRPPLRSTPPSLEPAGRTRSEGRNPAKSPSRTGAPPRESQATLPPSPTSCAPPMAHRAARAARQHPARSARTRRAAPTLPHINRRPTLPRLPRSPTPPDSPTCTFKWASSTPTTGAWISRA